MNIITLDFETYFADDFTLSSMTTEEYVRDTRLEVHGVGIRWNEYPDARCSDTIWYDHDIKNYLLQIDWRTTAVLCHHAQFDGLILSHVYGIKPAYYLDTLSMARLLFGNHIKKSLGALAELFGLGAKELPYDLFKGRHWHELTPRVQRQVADGCCQDVKLTWDLFCKLAKSFPASEYAFVDATVRMFTSPVLEGDTALLAEIWQQEARTKAALLARLGLTTTELRKQHVFAKLLRAEGIEPEQKLGKPAKCKACDGVGHLADENCGVSTCRECEGQGTITRYNYSFAKTDDFMRQLLEDETPLVTMPEATVAMLAQAKLDAHANGTQTRVERMGHMSTRGPLCVYLNYAGTHLSGWSGGDKMNWQNFRRGGPIAGAIDAPAGHAVVCADASQIECRLLECVAGEDLTDWREGKDPYCTLATKFYNQEVYKAKPGDPRAFEMECMRGMGKQFRLSCGYGAGGPTIQATARRGTYGPPVHLTDAEALEGRDLYRAEKVKVVGLWTEAGDVLKKLHAGLEFDWNVVHIKDKVMWLPNGVPLLYDTIEWHETEVNGEPKKGWRVRSRKGWSWLYGAKFVENLIQALRNVFIRQAWQECIDAGLPVVSMEHDKLICLARESEADDALAFLQQAMSRPPAWLPNIPLDSEGFVSETFAK